MDYRYISILKEKLSKEYLERTEVRTTDPTVRNAIVYCVLEDYFVESSLIPNTDPAVERICTTQVGFEQVIEQIKLLKLLS